MAYRRESSRFFLLLLVSDKKKMIKFPLFLICVFSPLKIRDFECFHWMNHFPFHLYSYLTTQLYRWFRISMLLLRLTSKDLQIFLFFILRWRVIKYIFFVFFGLFWSADLKNNLFYLKNNFFKKNIILIHFNMKITLKKQSQLHFQTDL
jgi:hypothetical protein